MTNLEFDYGKSIVTGGAGFIGSHLVKNLIYNKNKVIVIDNLSSGKLSNLEKINKKNLEFINSDLKNSNALKQYFNDVNTIFHLAAYPEVRTGFKQPSRSYEENTRNTFYLLEEVRKSDIENFVFTSTSTVYGEATDIPTKENYGPLLPISPYGASKLAGEGLVSSYCATYGIRGIIFRLANVVGAKSNHGVIWDFINKLTNNPHRLEVLGDGTQSKSYIHVEDCVNCFLYCLEQQQEIELFNVGNVDETDVLSIAKIVCNTMNLKDVEIITTDEMNDGRGWIGDVKKMNLDISKLKQMGWSPNFSSLESIKLAAKELYAEKLMN